MKKLLLSLLLLSFSFNLMSQDVPFTQRLPIDGITLKGNMTFVANSIVNRQDNLSSPNDPYNGAGSNSSFDLQYIDIDDNYGILGSEDTFSSSKSSLNLPSCSRVVWAGLYWSAVYANRPTGPNTYQNIKIKLPGTNYQDITADEVIFDNGIADRNPYTCFKDMTIDVQALSNPNGDYFAANIQTTTGQCCGGTPAGWVMVVVYENETESSKHFSVFDGFSTVQAGDAPIQVSYDGFRTGPSGPVRTQMLIAGLEGDSSFLGDRFEIRDTSGNFVPQSNTLNPSNNFFNSSISSNDAYLTGRDPSSTNTLGFDVDMFDITNPGNTVIDNNQTSIETRFVTGRDGYWVFLNAIVVEVIESDIKLVKTIDDGSGVDLAGATLSLGSDLWYNLRFQNVGTDDATNTIIKDRLPKNVSLITSDIVLPSGVTLSNYEVPSESNDFRGELTLSIDDSLVEEGGAIHNIRFRCQLASDCEGFKDRCSNVIESSAFISFEGANGGVRKENVPSISGIDACGIGIYGATIFLVDTSVCNSSIENITVCESSVDLTAGEGFESYVWEKNGTTFTTGNTRTITVTESGAYTVTKISPSGTPVSCVSFNEAFNVSINGIANPLINYADNIRTCATDGSQLVDVYLNDTTTSKNIVTGVSAPNTVKWQQLKASCVSSSNINCSNSDDTCWEDLPTNSTSYTRDFSEEGQFRLVIENENGCVNKYYFNIFQENISPTIDIENIICGSNGTITVNNVPTDHQYALVLKDNPAPDASAYQSSNVFSVDTEGNYDLYIRNTITSSVFYYPNQQINTIDLDAEVTIQPVLCAGETGEINVQLNSAISGPYTYKLLDGFTVVNTFGPTTDSNVIFPVTNSGNYTVEVSTSGCVFSEPTSIAFPQEMIVDVLKVRDISCSDEGEINLTVDGGTANYSYAIWSYTPASTATKAPISYTNVGEISPTDFFTTTNYTIPSGEEGTYEFIAIDSNNCSVISSSVAITTIEPEVLTMSNVEVTKNATCDPNTGATVEVTANGGVPPYEFSVDGGTTWQVSSIFTNLTAGVYDVLVRDTSNCPINECTVNTFANGNFEEVTSTVSTFKIVDETEIEGWKTTAADNQIEIFKSGFQGIPASSGDHFVELNANIASTLYQEFCTKPGDVISWSIDHRGRTGTDVAELRIGGSITPSVSDFSQQMTDEDSAWGAYSGSYTVPAGQTTTVISLTAISSASGNLAVGNLIDNVVVNVNYAAVTAPYELTIDSPSPIVFTTDVNNCNTGVNGEITIEVSEGNGDYNFSLDGGPWITPDNSSPALYTFTGLISGNHQVSVRDSAGCISNSTVTILPELTGTATVENISGLDNIVIAAVGGSSSYEYSADNGVTYQNDNTFIGLTPNSYTLKVRDTNGCVADVGVDDTTCSVDFTVTLVKEIGCVDPDAEIELSITSGSGNYEYSVLDSVGNVVIARSSLSTTTTNFFVSLSGTYTVIVFDTGNASECSVSKDISVEPPVYAEFTVTSTDPTCSGSATGIITVDSTNGQALTYTLSQNGVTVPNVVFDASINSFINVIAGDYSITATDVGGCISPVVAVTLSEDPPITINNPIVTQFGCESGNVSGNAAITIDLSSDVIGGSGIYNTIEVFNDNGTSGEFSDDVKINGTNNNGVYSFEISDTNGGSFYAKVVDSEGCEAISPFVTVDPYDELQAITVSQREAISCSNGGELIDIFYTSSLGNSTADVTILDGTGAVVETISGVKSNTTTSNTVSITTNTVRLISGIYTIIVANPVNGCEVTGIYQVNDVATYTATITNTSPIACFGDNNASITLTVEFSTGVYTGEYNYEVFTETGQPSGISGVSTGSTLIDGLSSGNYYVQVTLNDAPSCVLRTQDLIINGPASELNHTASIQEVNCNADNSGSINVSATGGWGGYEYQLENLTTGLIERDFNSDNIFTNLSSGEYTIKVRDFNGCENSSNITLTDPTPINGVASLITPNTIEISSVVGGTPPYEYSIDGNVFSSIPIFENLENGVIYIPIIRDSKGCTSYLPPILTSQELLIAADDSFVGLHFIPGDITSSVVNNDTLYGNPVTIGFGEGEVSINTQPSGVTNPDELSLDIHTGQITVDANAPSGTYLYTYEICENGANPANCDQATVTIVVIDSNTPLLLVASDDAVSTPLDTSVSIDVLANDTNVPVNAILDIEVQPANGTVTIDDNGTQNDTSDDVIVYTPNSSFVGDDTFVYQICDNDCDTATVFINVVPLNPLLEATLTTIDNNCNGNSEGIIEISVTGGVTPYKYTLIAGTTALVVDNPNNIFTNLLAGNYTVEVVDDLGTKISLDATITEPAPLFIDSNVVANGSVELIGSGGTAPYEYSVARSAFTTNNVFNLQPGDYDVTIRDANGCIATNVISVTGSNTTPIANNDTITTISDASVAINIFQNDVNIPTVGFLTPNTPLNGVVTVDDFGTPNDPSDDLVIYTPNSNFVGTDTFTYTICDNSIPAYCATATVTIVVEPSNLPLNIDVITSDVTCNGSTNGFIQINVNGGRAPFNFELFDAVGAPVTNGTFNIFTNLSSGVYTVRVSDDNGLTETLPNIIINESEVLSTVLVSTNVSCNGADDGRVTVNTTGGSGSYVYKINSGSRNYQTDNVFTNLAPGNYTISILDDAGCEDEAEVTITEPTPLFISSVDIRATGRFPSGRIKVGADGGTPRYQYSINGGAFRRSNKFLDLEDGSYTILVQDSNGCISNPFTVQIDKIEINNTVSQVAEVLEMTYKNAVSYQWIDVDDDIRIPGANKATYTPTKSGRFQVEMVVNETSLRVQNQTTVRRENTQIILSPVIEYKIETLGIDDVEKNIFKVYPNPTSERLVLPTTLIRKTYKIYSILGKEVQSDVIYSEEIQVNELAKGVYFLRVDGFEPVRFIKR